VNTLRLAIEHGYIPAERPIACGHWVLKKQSLDPVESKRLLDRVRQNIDPTVLSSAQAVLDLSTT
jgi:hypothetical protein